MGEANACKSHKEEQTNRRCIFHSTRVFPNNDSSLNCIFGMFASCFCC